MTTTPATRITLAAAGEGHTVQVLTDLCRRSLSAEQTGGAYDLYTVTVPPGGGPPLHRHPPAETFVVVDGELAVLGASGTELPARPGDAVHIPSGEPHGYRNAGAGMARMIVIVHPPGLQPFFDDLGVRSDGATEPAPMTGPPDIDGLMRITAAHGIEMLGS
jgi:quercetin dioxygenase-like cupin family protein